VGFGSNSPYPDYTTPPPSRSTEGGNMRQATDLSPLVVDIVKADARYFLNNRFICPHFYDSVMLWLGGKDNKEAVDAVAHWLESDADYFDYLAKSLCRHHWYIYPLMWIMMKVVPKRLRTYARKLGRQ